MNDFLCDDEQPNSNDQIATQQKSHNPTNLETSQHMSLKGVTVRYFKGLTLEFLILIYFNNSEFTFQQVRLPTITLCRHSRNHPSAGTRGGAKLQNLCHRRSCLPFKKGGAWATLATVLLKCCLLYSNQCCRPAPLFLIPLGGCTTPFAAFLNGLAVVRVPSLSSLKFLFQRPNRPAILPSLSACSQNRERLETSVQNCT